VGGKIGIDRSHVAPVARLLGGAYAGDAIPAEIVGKHPVRLNQAWQQILAEILFSQPVPFPQRLDQHIGRENVVSHRGEGARRITGHRRRLGPASLGKLRTLPSSAASMMPNAEACPMGTGNAAMLTSAWLSQVKI
jgi:hypothetical protein